MYRRYLNLLNLIYEMQASNDGVSYEDIQAKYGVSRRTAERMIRAILESNPDVEIVRQRPKRWRIKNAIAAPSPTLQQLAALDAAAKLFKNRGMQEYRKDIEALNRFLKVNMDHSRLTRIDADLATLKDAEGFSYRPGPVQVIESGVLEGLREAVKGFNVVSFDYTSSSGKTMRWFDLHPYGFLHGNNTRSYLLAFVDHPKINALRTFTLSKISMLEVYGDQFFEKQPEHSVENYLKNCFGVFKERRAYNVCWRFDAEYAEVVEQWIFHPSQQVKKRRDGRIEVRFKACGLYEMAWHVITWGGIIEVVRPKVLINTLREIKDSIRLPD